MPSLEEAMRQSEDGIEQLDDGLITPVNDVFMINPETRIIEVPESERLFGVNFDKDVEKKYFKCPKIVGNNIDLSKHKIYVVYQKADESITTLMGEVGKYWCEDVKVDETGDYIEFSWLLSGNVLRERGFIAFKVVAVYTDTGTGELKTRWNTVPSVGLVRFTLSDGEEITEQYADIISQLLSRMDAVEDIATPEAMQGYVEQYLNAHPTELDETLTDSKKAAPANLVGQLKDEFVDKLSELTSTTNCKFSQFAKIVDAKEAMIVEYKKYNDNEIYDVSVATGKNLLPVSTEYPSVINASNGAVIKFTNSGIINYNGEKATGESIEQNVLDADSYLFKVPFEAELSNKFNVTKGGFTSHIWIDDGQGNLSIEEFTHGAITLKKGTIIKKIWFKANESNSIFDVAFSLVEKGEEADYTAPTLKIYTNDNLQKIKFAYGTNYVIPNFINDAKENTIVYMDDNCISKQQKFALVKVTTDESVINIPQTISTQKFLNRDKKWNIYGKDKNLSVLKCDDVNYSCSILELCAGIVKNVMLYNATMGESNKGYCVHLDSNNLENEYVLFENCIFKSTEGISIGIGTRAGSTIVFKNCEFITEDDSYTFYIHNTESEGKNKCSIVIENCLFRTNGEICMLIQDWQGCCKNDFLFVNNTFMNDDKYNLNNAVKINYHHGVEENSTDWKNLLSLNKSSHGNNITFLNAVN